MMTRKSVRTVIFCIFLLFNAVLQNCYAKAPVPKRGWFFGVGGSEVWQTLTNKSATVLNGSTAPPPFNADLYTIKNPTTTTSFSLYGGYRFTRAKRIFPDYSLAFRFQQLNSSTTRGIIQQYSLPAFTNYNYSLRMASHIFSLEGKADLFHMGRLSPYISGGLGVAVNTVSGYSETPTSGVTPRNSPSYGNYSTNNFMFDLGAGFDFQITRKCQAFLGYEYASLGSVRTNSGTNAWSGQYLSLGRLKTSAVSLGVFYQIA